MNSGGVMEQGVEKNMISDGVDAQWNISLQLLVLMCWKILYEH